MRQKDKLKLKGRGAQAPVDNQFSTIKYEMDHDLADFSLEEIEKGVKTTYLEVFPRSIVNAVASKDIYMNWSMNPYQGCEHGCSYCYARPTHEYWGYGPGLDFERSIMYKPNAVNLLRKFFNRNSWKPEPIMLSGNTDCYQPAERKFKLTRQLLEVMNEYRNPVGIITKNSLIERDIDILSEMASDDLVVVNISLTTLNEELRSKLEPRTSTTKNKLTTIEKLTAASVPVRIMIGPVIPGLNSHEIPDILKASAQAGANWAGFIPVRLNGAVQEIFRDWLYKSYPERMTKVLNLIRESNGGVLSNSIDAGRMKGKGQTAKMIKDLFDLNRRKYMTGKKMTLNTSLFARPGQQLNLF